MCHTRILHYSRPLFFLYWLDGKYIRVKATSSIHDKVVRPCASDYTLISITVIRSNRCHVMWLVDLFSRNPLVYLLRGCIFRISYYSCLINITKYICFFLNKIIFKNVRNIIRNITRSCNWLLQMHSNKERHNLNSKQENWRESSGYRI